ncbi:13530_t:CDS:2, partial [Gigaspora margarita]
MGRNRTNLKQATITKKKKEVGMRVKSWLSLRILKKILQQANITLQKPLILRQNNCMIGLKKKKELELASPFVRQLNISLHPKYLLLKNKLKTWIRTLRSSQKVVSSKETRNNDSCEDDNEYGSNE